MRRVGEPVTVRVAETADPGSDDPAPTTFLWRGRLYVVREVLAHWRERQAWWTAAAARAVHGEGGQGELGLGEPGGGFDGVGEGGRRVETTLAAGKVAEFGQAELEIQEVRPMAPGTRVVLDHEHEVWRVEASAGRSFGTGVYDLSREAHHPGPAWLLLRVTD